MNQSQQQSQKQQQKQGYFLSQQHLKLMHLMHLSGFALQEFLANEVEQNPALEMENENVNEEETETMETDNVFDSELFDNDDMFEKKYYQSNQPEEYYEAPVVQYSSLQDNLKEQIHQMKLRAEIVPVACYIIDELDDDGYLRIPLSEVSFDYGFATGRLHDENNFVDALMAVQQCDPAGIASRDLRECLLLQVKRKVERNRNALHYITAQLILENHYNLFVQHKFTKLQELLNISEEVWKSVFQVILHLNPKPVTETNKYEIMRQQIIPDFEVTIEDDEIYVSLTQIDSTKLRVNPEFEKCNLLRHSASEKKQAENYFLNLVEDAQVLVNALKEREATMMKVMSVIVAMQPIFFRTGDMKDLKPMILLNVASASGYDVSTVSRITSNKYVQTPHGIFTLKNLFMRNINPDAELNSQNTVIGIQDEIKKIIETENKYTPYSDSEVAKILRERDITIARRTVVKYRVALGIPNSTMRKK